jgi:hypothetical protein
MDTGNNKNKRRAKAKQNGPEADNVTVNVDPTITKSSPRRRRNLRSVINNLDITSLHEDDISDLLLHCASALSLRKVLYNSETPLAKSAANYCYTKAGDDPTVSIWSGGFKVGETSEANAQASGIPPCGG